MDYVENLQREAEGYIDLCVVTKHNVRELIKYVKNERVRKHVLLVKLHKLEIDLTYHD